MLSKKGKVFKIYMHQKTSHTKEAFTKIRNYYFRCFRIKKQEYYRTKFAKYKSDIRSTWRSINFLLGKAKSNECSSWKIHNNVINGPAEIANNFNNHFATAAANLTSSLPFSDSLFSNYLGPRYKDSMFVWPTSPYEIRDIIRELTPKLSAGFDEIPSKVPKSSPEIVLVALSHIFNLLLSAGKFINDFKLAKVFPVFRKGDPHVTNPY